MREHMLGLLLLLVDMLHIIHERGEQEFDRAHGERGFVNDLPDKLQVVACALKIHFAKSQDSATRKRDGQVLEGDDLHIDVIGKLVNLNIVVLRNNEQVARLDVGRNKIDMEGSMTLRDANHTPHLYILRHTCNAAHLTDERGIDSVEHGEVIPQKKIGIMERHLLQHFGLQDMDAF